MKKGLTRFIFIVVFLIPVVWYLFLQLFGSNNYTLELKKIIEDCDDIRGVTIIRTHDTVTISQSNYLERINYAAEKRSIPIIIKEDQFFKCIGMEESDVVLVSDSGLWGAYSLSRKGVDELIAELDILILQMSYGEGTYR